MKQLNCNKKAKTAEHFSLERKSLGDTNEVSKITSVAEDLTAA